MASHLLLDRDHDIRRPRRILIPIRLSLRSDMVCEAVHHFAAVSAAHSKEPSTDRALRRSIVGMPVHIGMTAVMQNRDAVAICRCPSITLCLTPRR